MARKDIREFYQKDVQDLSPVEFEKCCLEILRGYAEEQNLPSFSITHNKIIKAHDSDYQVDIYAEYTIFGESKIRILVECKQYKNAVKRERVELLNSRLQNTGCNKGILMTTARFQSGAIRFAEEHGISLIEVMNTCDRFHSYASGPSYQNSLPLEDEILLRSPVYYADIVTENPRQIYPTGAMIHDIVEEIHKERIGLL